MCSVMAWGATISVGEGGTYPATDAGLNQAIAAASAGDVIELTSDIAYATNGTGLINITKSITLDGQGYKINGYGICNLNIDAGKTKNYNVVIAVNNAGESNANLSVTIKNLRLKHTNDYDLRAIAAFDGVSTLNLEKDSIVCKNVTVFVNGKEETALNLNIRDSYLKAKSYTTYLQKKINLSIEKSYLEGYGVLYCKRPNYSVSDFGSNIGTKGSVLNVTNSYLSSTNANSGRDNDFAIIPLEDVGITVNLDNCGMNALETGYSQQVLCIASGWTPEDRRGETASDAIKLTISGDNSHFNLSTLFESQLWMPYSVAGPEILGSLSPIYNATPIEVVVKGGTYSVDPSTLPIYYNVTKVHTVQPVEYGGASADRPDPAYSEHWNVQIPDGYEVKTITMEGVATPLYRVVKKAAKDGSGDPLYNLNSDVPEDEPGAGNNPASSFELSDGSDMTLNQQVTKAGYVQVMDDATEGATTVTVGKASGADKDQTLIINNGLDVQGDSKVEVKAGSTLEIGEGGINTQKPENIVINADENGAASLLLDPTITVNQTPNLTVRMTAKQIGRDGEGDFYWHRFALPVAAGFTSWEKEGNLVPADPNYTVKYPTYLYAWDYANNDWANIAPNQMVPLQGYTLTLASDYIRVEGGKVVSEDTKNGNLTELQDVVYTFKGNLVGNEDQPLNFQHEGFNFFGNSYTGYMHVKTMLQGLVDAHIDGTAYMWNGDEQAYYGVSLHKLISGKGLEDWQQEVAPMQTFILRLRGANSADEEVKYAASIWGNPRYGHSATSAPRRAVAAISEDTYMEIAVKAANGKASRVDFTESANTSDAFESGYDVEKYMNEKTINLYATVNGMNLSSVVTDNIEGKTLSLKTNGEIAYTMSFKNVEGAEYAIRDNATGAVIAIEEGATYEFAAQPNCTVEGRFEIVAAAKIPTSIDNTEVKANVKGIYTIMGQYLGENFDILPAGVYVVDGVKIVK